LPALLLLRWRKAKVFASVVVFEHRDSKSLPRGYHAVMARQFIKVIGRDFDYNTAQVVSAVACCTVDVKANANAT
jgi:hypothetical protein